MTVPHSKLTRKLNLTAVVLSAALALSPIAAFAAGSGSSNDDGGKYSYESTSESMLLIRAKKDIRNKNYQAAYDRISAGIASDPDNADLHNLLGFSARKLMRYEASEQHYTKALDLDPKHKGALEYMGELYLTLNKIEEAEKLRERLSDVCWLGCQELKILDKAISDWKKSNS